MFVELCGAPSSRNDKNVLTWRLATIDSNLIVEVIEYVIVDVVV